MRFIIAVIVIALCVSCKSSHNSCDAYGMVDKKENQKS